MGKGQEQRKCGWKVCSASPEVRPLSPSGAGLAGVQGQVLSATGLDKEH